MVMNAAGMAEKFDIKTTSAAPKYTTTMAGTSFDVTAAIECKPPKITAPTKTAKTIPKPKPLPANKPVADDSCE